MAKNLTRPGRAHPINSMLGVQDTPASSVPLSLIRIGEHNPRTMFLSEPARQELFSQDALSDLIASMTEGQQDGERRGVLQPLLVRPLGDGSYELVAGERRYHAARWAGLTEVPVLIRTMNAREALEAALIENAQRDDPDMVRQTLAGFALLREHTGLETPELVRHLNDIRLKRTEDTSHLDELLKRIFGTGISTWSQQRSRILQLSDAEQEALSSGKLEAKALFPLIKLGELPSRKTLLETLLALPQRPSSSDVERRVAELLSAAPDAGQRRVTAVRKLLPGLRRLSGERAKRADTLLSQLERLLKEK